MGPFGYAWRIYAPRGFYCQAAELSAQVGADPKRKACYGNSRHASVISQITEGVAKILPKRIHAGLDTRPR